jgi:Putative beta-lactamase-inhibitor-like, PepSY-like
MKKLLLVALMFAVTPSFAHKTDPAKVPIAVKQTFHDNFPEIKDGNWEKEHGNYEVTFMQGGAKVSATYDKNGTWLETERKISTKALPPAANVYIEKTCKGHLVHAAFVIKNAKGETTYEARVKGKDYIFDADGKFIKIEKD